MNENVNVGVDIISVNRFRDMPYEIKSSFYKKIFHKNEIDYCLKFKDPYIHFAGKFALKEAVKKSINEKIYISKIETLHKDSKPVINLLEFENKYIFRASISHENNHAIAMVISELTQ